MAMSCDRNEIAEEESVVIEGLQDAIQFAAVPTGDVTFSITSNVNWSISQKDLDWVTITPSRGLGDKETVTVTVSPDVNTALEPREGTFTLSAGSVARTVKLTQAKAETEPVFNVSGAEGDTFYVEALDIEGATFNVSSNRDWTATLAEMDWATVTPLSGEKDRSATISVIPKAINEGEAIEGTISFEYGAAAPKVIKLVHKEFEPVITLSVEEVTASSTGVLQNPVVVVSSNAPWTAVSNADWITLDKEEGELGDTEVTVSVLANGTGVDRSGTVSFINKTVTTILTVNQGNEFVSVSKEKISTTKTQETFEVSANTDWVVTSSEAWATVSPAEGTGNGTVTVTMDPIAAGAGSRTAQITVAAKGDAGVSAVVELEQKEQLMLNFIDIYQTPVLFNCSQQSWNKMYNPDYVSGTNTGYVSGLGTGRAQSYSHLENTDLYMQFVDTDVEGYQSVSYIMPVDGALTMKSFWKDDAYQFHIPVQRLDAGTKVHFDFGLVAGGSNMPRIWAAEVSFDGDTWAMFDTGKTEVSANYNETGNVIFTKKQKVADRYQAVYEMPESVQKVEMLVRLRIVDAKDVLDKSGKVSSASAPSSTSVRLIGYEHPWVEKQEEPVVYGPTIYVDSNGAAPEPEPSTLTVSPATLTTVNTAVAFAVTSNTDWTVACSESWVTVTPATGYGNATVTVKPAALEAGAASRTATITVTTADNAVSQTVTLTQNAPEPVGPVGNYVDLVSTPVLFCSNNYAWNVTNNPDYATSGENGSDTKKPDTETLYGSGKGTGKLYSYSHYDNKDVYMQFASPADFAPAFLMAAEGNITAKNVWTDGAFTFYVPVYKLEAGKTLCFDYGTYATNKSARYWISEVSLDGGSTWAAFDTGQTYETPGLKVAANTDLGTATKIAYYHAGTYTIANTLENTMIIVRLRCADGTYYMNGTTATKPNSSAAVRIIGYDHKVEADANAETVKGPKIYIR